MRNLQKMVGIFQQQGRSSGLIWIYIDYNSFNTCTHFWPKLNVPIYSKTLDCFILPAGCIVAVLDARAPSYTTTAVRDWNGTKRSHGARRDIVDGGLVKLIQSHLIKTSRRVDTKPTEVGALWVIKQQTPSMKKCRSRFYELRHVFSDKAVKHEAKTNADKTLSSFAHNAGKHIKCLQMAPIWWNAKKCPSFSTMVEYFL